MSKEKSIGQDVVNADWKKKIILFLASQTISLFGSSLVQYAIGWYITLKTQSGVMMTISIICGFLPTFFLSPFAGVWADRYNRKILIILSDSMIALSTFGIAILFMMGYDAPWLLFVVSAVRALGTAVQTPAVGAFIPQLVPEDKLTKVNAANSSIQSMIMLVSPMLSGVLLTIATMETIFFIDVFTAASAVLVLLLFLHVPTHAKALEKQTTSYFSDMYEGYRYIRNHGFVKKIFMYCGIFFILAAPIAFLTPLQVTRSFGSDVWRLTAIEIVFSGGMMLGGIVMAFWGGFKNKIHTMVLSTLITGLGTFALGVAPIFWIYLSFMGLVGIVMPMFNTPFTVLLQQKVEENFLGRVFGVLSMISSIMMPLGMLVFGPVSDFIKIEWLLIGTGILMLIESFFMFVDKVLIDAGKPI
ncbi:MFS transporter [Pseudobacteroides cellulosolvens]|uniref:Major facilitator superfamily MFS_1 n=1 Tax=Pseudobacteroides cellulosolvens ATCC 35603 = DSM 2933 TaxID=398512 RepID=A0A0L6JUQ9_9FIRM|nr:MFS transporter [Pseudobacteroides cellulosolvens]KNY29449.1 major facilitator superfamily MFS_1 [Pseudobacteroides cellulosolvens ATCC 35603 = DSM 2933]